MLEVIQLQGLNNITPNLLSSRINTHCSDRLTGNGKLCKQYCSLLKSLFCQPGCSSDTQEEANYSITKLNKLLSSQRRSGTVCSLAHILSSGLRKTKSRKYKKKKKLISFCNWLNLLLTDKDLWMKLPKIWLYFQSEWKRTPFKKWFCYFPYLCAL